MDSSAAPAIAKSLGIGEGLEHPPLLRFERQHGQKRHGDDQQAVEERRPHLAARGDDGLQPGPALREPLQVLVRVLGHHDRRVHHAADRDRDAAQAHDVGVHAENIHHDEGDQHADGQHHDRHQRAAHVHQEYDADERDDHALLDQGTTQCVDRAVNQVGAVVHRLDRDALGQAARDLGDLGLQVVNHVLRVLAKACHCDAADNFALAVELGDAAALLRHQLDARHVAHQHRRAALGLYHEVLQVGDAAQVAAAAHHVLGLGELDHAAADVAVAVADHLHHLHQRHAVGLQHARVHCHLVLPDKAADAGDLGDAVRLG